MEWVKNQNAGLVRQRGSGCDPDPSSSTDKHDFETRQQQSTDVGIQMHEDLDLWPLDTFQLHFQRTPESLGLEALDIANVRDGGAIRGVLLQPLPVGERPPGVKTLRRFEQESFKDNVDRPIIPTFATGSRRRCVAVPDRQNRTRGFLCGIGPDRGDRHGRSRGAEATCGTAASPHLVCR